MLHTEYKHPYTLSEVHAIQQIIYNICDYIMIVIFILFILILFMYYPLLLFLSILPIEIARRTAGKLGTHIANGQGNCTKMTCDAIILFTTKNVVKHCGQKRGPNSS